MRSEDLFRRIALVGGTAIAVVSMVGTGCSSADPNNLEGASSTSSEDLRKHCAANPAAPGCDAGRPSGGGDDDGGDDNDDDGEAPRDAASRHDGGTTKDAAPPPPPVDAGIDATKADAAPPPPAPSVSFANQVQPIFTNSCAGCHGGGGTAPDLSSGAAYGAIVNVTAGMCSTAKYVVPGSAAQSFLVAAITSGGSVGSCSGGFMAGHASSSDLATITSWVNEGAPNN